MCYTNMLKTTKISYNFIPGHSLGGKRVGWSGGWGNWIMNSDLELLLNDDVENARHTS